MPNAALSPLQSDQVIPVGLLVVVRADLNSRCFSPALYGDLYRTANHRRELAERRDDWVQALCSDGVEPGVAAKFVRTEEARVLNAVNLVDLRYLGVVQ